MIKYLILGAFFTLFLTETFAQRIFWAERNTGKIRVANLSASSITGATDFITGVSTPIDLAVDQQNGRLYYGDNSGEDILAADLSDGSFIEAVITTGAMVYFEDFSYSENNDAIYAAMNSEVHGVYMIPSNNADGGSETSLSLGGLDNDDYLGIVADDGNELIHVIDYNQNSVLTTDFGGTGGGFIVGMSDQMEQITLDKKTNKLYIVAYRPSPFDYRIYSCNTDGTGLTMLASLGTNQITSIQAYSGFGKIFFAQNNVIRSMNLDGTGLTNVLSLGAVGLEDIAIEGDYVYPTAVAFTPADNTTNIVTNTSLTITFDEPIVKSTATGTAAETSLRIYRTTGNMLEQTIDRSSANVVVAGNVVTISGFTLTQNNTSYYVQVGTKFLTDASKNEYFGISSTTAWNFTTEPPVTLSGPSASACVGSYQALPNLVITEGGSGNFSAGTNVTLIFTAGTGYTFQSGVGSVTFTAARNITAASVAVTTTTITVTYSVTGTNLLDAMTISGIKFTTNSAANPGVDITRTGGTGVVGGLVNTTVVGATYSQAAAPVPVVTYPQGSNLCQGSSMAANVASATGTGQKWYNDAALTSEIVALAGQGSATGTQLGISAASPATFTKYVTQTSGGCESASTTITIVIDPPPTVSNAGGDQAVCGTSATLAGNTPAVGTGAWTITSGAGGTVTTPTSPTSTFTGIAGNTYVLQWTISNSTCTPSTDNVSIKLDANPTASNAGTNQTVCGTSVSLAANAPLIGTGTWSVLTGAGGTVANPTSQTSGFTGVAGTTYTLQWAISNGSCPASTSTVQIKLDANPTVSNAGSNQIVCGSSATLAGNTPTVGTGAWTIVTGAGGTVTTPASPTSSFTGTPGTTYVLQWTISNGSCVPNSSNVTIQLDAPPSTAAAGTDQDICGTTTTLAATTSAIGSGTWTIVSGAGGIIATPSSPTSGFTGVAGTTYVLQWAVANGVCAASTDNVSIRFYAAPTVAIAGGAQTLCGNTAVLAANTPLVGTGAWAILSGAGGTVATPSSPTSNFTGVAGTTYTLRWTISNGTCTPSTSDVAISLVANPTTAAAGADQLGACVSTTLAGNTPAIGTGTWSILSGAGGSLTNASSPASGFSGTGGTSYTLRWTISNTGCPQSTDDVVVQFVTPPTVAAAGSDQKACGTSTNLAGNTPASGTGAWTIQSGAGGTITDPTSATSSFSGTSGTTYTLRWTISRVGCSSTSDDVSITFNALPSGTGIIAGLGSICPEISGDFTVSGISNATSYRWDVGRGLEIISQNGTTAAIKAVGDPGLVTITVEGENDCGIGGSAKKDINILSPPDITLDIPSEAFIDDPVAFSYSTSATIQSQTWSFGDGGTSDDASTEHIYTSSGDVTIALDVVDDKGCINSAGKTMVVHPEAELSSFSIKNVVTANGDDKNRYLYIDRIERFPESEVIVLDRLGVEVFRKTNYVNDWDLRKGEDFLPAGNYVCVVKSNGKVYSRSVTVIKGK